MKRCSILFVIRGNVNQNHTNCCFTSVRMAIIKKKKGGKQEALVRMWKTGTLVHYWWEWKLVQPLWRLVVPQKNWTELSYNPAIPLPSKYPKELKTKTETDTCTPMLSAELFTKIKGGHNPSTHQQKNKQNVVYKYNGVLFTHRKKGSSDTYYNMDAPLKVFC